MKNEILELATKVNRTFLDLRALDGRIHKLTSERATVREDLDEEKKKLLQMVLSEGDTPYDTKVVAINIPGGNVITVSKDQGVRIIEEVIHG